MNSLVPPRDRDTPSSAVSIYGVMPVPTWHCCVWRPNPRAKSCSSLNVLWSKCC